MEYDTPYESLPNELKQLRDNVEIFKDQYAKFYKGNNDEIREKAAELFEQTIEKEFKSRSENCMKSMRVKKTPKNLKKLVKKLADIKRKVFEKISNETLCIDCSKHDRTYWVCNIKNDFGDSKINVIPVFFTKNPSGNIYYSFPSSGFTIGMYSHFFDRLQQRFFKDINDRAIALSRLFSDIKGVVDLNPNNNNVVTTIYDGLLLGKYIYAQEKGAKETLKQLFVYYKTFVDEKKLFPNQLKKVEFLKNKSTEYESSTKTSLLDIIKTANLDDEDMNVLMDIFEEFHSKEI